MSSTTVYSEIKGFLQTLYNGVYPVVDFDEIDPVLSQGTDPFLALEEVTSDETMISIGDLASVCLRETGAVVVQCFTPAPQSSSAARTIADTVRESIRFRSINAVRIFEASPPDLAIMNDGLWTAGAFSVSYEYDTHIPHPNGA